VKKILNKQGKKNALRKKKGATNLCCAAKGNRQLAEKRKLFGEKKKTEPGGGDPSGTANRPGGNVEKGNFKKKK